MKKSIIAIAALLGLFACQKAENEVNPSGEGTGKVIFKFKFDPQQERLDGLGNPSPMPAGNAGQSPAFNLMSAHYFELTPTAFTALGGGTILYQALEVTTGGETAIDFEKSKNVKEGETVLEIPVKDIKAGNYEYLRVSLAYQNYTVKFRALNMDLEGTVASFIGFRTYLKTYKVKNTDVAVNGNRAQGYWAFETQFGVTSGQAARTTVPNPLFATSPIPAGSCVVTAKFDKPLTITGKENKDITITISLSTNNSFEWRDLNGNKIWEPVDNEAVVDMGVRGMKVLVN
ncbi:MAG: hypothetical protein MUE81_01035 [Thermoflexibacter sp.]|jgi:hypothetical protein|nr:hypothetical protein [Thermoflexibacter sp.]